jgi:hypothetical protein
MHCNLTPVEIWLFFSWDEAKEIPKDLHRKAAAEAGILPGMNLIFFSTSLFTISTHRMRSTSTGIVGSPYPSQYAPGFIAGGVKHEEFDAL